MEPESVESSRPRWLKDLVRFLPLKSQFVLSGNVRDLHVVRLPDGTPVPLPISSALGSTLVDYGFEHVLLCEPNAPTRVLESKSDSKASASEVLGRLGAGDGSSSGANSLGVVAQILQRVADYADAPICLILDFASRLVVRGDILSEAEQQLLSIAQIRAAQAAARPHGESGIPFFNTIIWIVDKETDLPDWFLINNPMIRHIPTGLPDHTIRRSISNALLRSMPDGGNAEDDLLDRLTDSFVEQTEGLLLIDMLAMAQLAQAEAVNVSEISDIVRRYKVGVTEDPWRKIDRRKISDGDAFIRRRLKGQDHAVIHALDIVKRAITGVGGKGARGRPRGVVFLAGPTGVGKTELAKTVTQLLFGDESAYIRFDMSEFNAEHADQRLIGAPPGYVGYDAGGELTNAIREKPFSVVLFDEIEKAHPRILDKFLQILDDGVLTSGRGERVYFTEAFIVFTSNLGIYGEDEFGNRVARVSQDDPFETVSQKVTEEIERYFKLVLNRPEILNRLGENIIVFDFIRPRIAIEIFDQMVGEILSDLAEQNIHIELAQEVTQSLRSLCLEDLSHGGRGIRNMLDAHLVNPLARALFDQGAEAGQRFRVENIETADVTTLSLATGG